ncbi:MAG: DNA double-strand break repair nuclease NurA [Chloroflexi bacterium]|nr:DNA double-strand break repair nuclease NurA [Chloroflexota bacterium]
MSLDLNRVAAQVVQMVARLKADGKERQKRLSRALDVLSEQSADIDSLKRKIETSKTTWLVAELVDGLDRHYLAPLLPDEFTVIATDGSHIDVDRHRSVRCYLINIGIAAFHYGAAPDAVLDSSPHLYAGDEDLVMTPAGVKGRQQPVEGALLGIKRSVDECQRLAELAVELLPGSSNLALLDGSLILWGLEDYLDFVTEALLKKGFLKHLSQLKKLNKDRSLALASYISSPRSSDVVNALRVALCPNDPLDTDRHCPECESRECEAIAGIQDSELFSNLLNEGERSAVFASQSSIVRQHYGEHRVYFFYLKLEDETARVEIPQWVARDENLLNLTHSLVLDQCRRGQGYPVALSEAHEEAVLREADRESFWQLVGSSLIAEKLPTPTSGKSRSKKTRWV